MKGIKIKIDDVSTSNSFDMIKLAVRVIAISKNLSLSETELYALTYFVINGYSKITREALVTNKLLKTKNTVSNLTYEFRKYGILVKTNFGEDLNEDFKINAADMDAIKLEMIIKK